MDLCFWDGRWSENDHEVQAHLFDLQPFASPIAALVCAPWHTTNHAKAVPPTVQIGGCIMVALLGSWNSCRFSEEAPSLQLIL